MLKSLIPLALVSLCLASWSPAQDATFDTVVEGFVNPTGVAIQPGTGHVFVADSGAQRVIRVVDGKIEEVIVGFPKESYGSGPLYDIGPLGLMFYDQETLVVGNGGSDDGEDRIAVYQVPDVGSAPIQADQTKGPALSIPAQDSAAAEGDFYGLAKTSRGVFVTCNGDDSRAWIALATMNADGQLKELSRSIALQEETKTGGLTAITLSPDGYLAIGQMGSISAKPDSLLTFCDPEDGAILATFKTGLKDITGLAYGPKRGRLFATDFNWNDTSNGALVKLVGTEDACESRTILQLEKPTALAFNAAGDLYITLAGNDSEGATTPDGKLVVVKGLDEEPANK